MPANGHDLSVNGETAPRKKESPSDPASTTTKKKSLASKLDPLLAKFPSWLSTATKDPRKWKTFVRCMVCLFANLVLLVCQPSRFYSLSHRSFSASPDFYASRSSNRRSSWILRSHRRLHPATLCATLSIHLPHAHHHSGHVPRLGVGSCGHGGGIKSEESDIVSESVYSGASESSTVRYKS